jgi:hypothetical protein
VLGGIPNGVEPRYTMKRVLVLLTLLDSSQGSRGKDETSASNPAGCLFS